jgi:hypothetical protein
MVGVWKFPSPNLSPHHAMKSSVAARGERDLNARASFCTMNVKQSRVMPCTFQSLSPLSVSACFLA